MSSLKFILLFVIVCFGGRATLGNPLDDYVNTPDPVYNYTLIKEYDMGLYKIHILNMTSLRWLNETYFDNPVWWHYLAVVVPKQILRPDAAFLWIYGSDNTEKFLISLTF